jgi:hypothetical protein
MWSACFGGNGPDHTRNHRALRGRLIRAMHWAQRYPLPEQYEPSPGDMKRLEDMGYAGKGR